MLFFQEIQEGWDFTCPFFMPLHVTFGSVNPNKLMKQLQKPKAMEDKLITLIVLPFSNAQILKSRLESKGIDCDLENMDLLDSTISSSVHVKILENDVQKAIPVLDDFLGKKTAEKPTAKNNREKHILVPVDFSKSSEKALIAAVNIATVLASKLVIMHCYINPLLHSIPSSDIYAYDSTLLARLENSEERANEKFRTFVEKISKEVGKEKWEKINIEFIIKHGYAEEDIIFYAQNHPTQLVIMGSGGKNEHSTTVGSITADVMYNAPVPVLVVPEESETKTEFNKLSKVLYATDFDEKDFVILDKLMKILKPFHTRLVCAHVGQPTENGWDLARLDGMKDILQEKYKNCEFECHLIVGRNTQESLEKFIREEKIEILTLTTHKRNMISRLFNPSLARKMVYHTNTPLLIFHA